VWTSGISTATSLATRRNSPQLAIFHVSQLKKCIRVPTEIIEQQEIFMEPDLSYDEHPIKVLDQKERGTRRKVVKMYKVQWNHHIEEEATWETESYLNQHYPGFLNSTPSTDICLRSFIQAWDEILFKGVGCDTLGV